MAPALTPVFSSSRSRRLSKLPPTLVAWVIVGVHVERDAASHAALLHVLLLLLLLCRCPILSLLMLLLMLYRCAMLVRRLLVYWSTMLPLLLPRLLLLLIMRTQQSSRSQLSLRRRR